MNGKQVVLWGGVVGLAAAAIWFARMRIHIADRAQAISFADHYFSELKAGNAAGVLRMYEPSIPANPTDALTKLLLAMQSQNGNVLAAELQNGTVAPKDDVACYWLTYNVTRARAKTVESFLLCPRNEGHTFGIAGHALLNPTTSQNVSFGTTLQSKTIQFGNAR